jgi:type I restriction enzyme S subunit
MRWKPYPEYKEPGINLLRTIPKGWEMQRLKRVTHFAYGDSLAAEDRVQGHYDVMGSNGIVGNHEKCNTKCPCLVVGRKGSFGKVAYSENPCFAIDTTYYIDESQTKNHLKWLYYCLLWLKLDAVSKDSAVPGLAREDAYGNFVPFCGIKEQQAIARFLDRETGSIDALIAKKQRQIELLQEKRSALISQVVTKGLNLNVKMKDSGVEWLGEIPEHWKVTPLRWLLIERDEYNIGPKTNNILSVVKDVGVINYDDRKASGNKKSDDIEQYKIIHKGDIVLNRMNVIIGSVGIAPEDGAASIEYYVLHAKDDSVFSNYYGHIFCSRAFQTNLGRLGSGILGHRQRIPYEVLRMECLPKPPYDEQRKIANFLDGERYGDDSLVLKVQESIDMVQEYRTALISAAVTGKIDVRQEVT